MKRSITRWKVRRRLVWVGGIAALAALLIADRAGWLLVRRIDDMAAYHGMQTRITAVLDGDTIEVALPDALHERPATRVRLWGIDCPEPARARQEAEPWAEEAAALCRSLTDRATMTLWLEPQRTRGVFGRVLAHVQLPDGSSLNEALLAAGLARTPPGDRAWASGRKRRREARTNEAPRPGRGRTPVTQKNQKVEGVHFAIAIDIGIAIIGRGWARAPRPQEDQKVMDIDLVVAVDVTQLPRDRREQHGHRTLRAVPVDDDAERK